MRLIIFYSKGLFWIVPNVFESIGINLNYSELLEDLENQNIMNYQFRNPLKVSSSSSKTKSIHVIISNCPLMTRTIKFSRLKYRSKTLDISKRIMSHGWPVGSPIYMHIVIHEWPLINSNSSNYEYELLHYP